MIDIHCESFFSDDPRAACQGGTGVVAMPQMAAGTFIFMIRHRGAKIVLCEGCLATVRKLVMMPAAPPPLEHSVLTAAKRYLQGDIPIDALGILRNERDKLAAKCAAQATELGKLEEALTVLRATILDLQDALAECTRHTEH